MRTLYLVVGVALLCSLNACGGGGSAEMTPDPCMSDGTPRGNCEAYNCAVMLASAAICPPSTVQQFNCTGIESFPEDYQMDVQDYFDDCAPTLAEYMDTEVETMQGPTTVSACAILGCAIKPMSQRSPGPGTIYVECAPVETPACDFPDPPVGM